MSSRRNATTRSSQATAKAYVRQLADLDVLEVTLPRLLAKRAKGCKQEQAWRMPHGYS
jgi:hypothetical protein